MSTEIKHRDTFASKIGFLLSTIGFSVGVGTLWRFPYICGKYGGGLFLLTYAILMVFVGIPLFSSEVSLGLATRKNPVGAYKILAPGKKWHITGWFNMICIIFVIGYTIPVYGWIIHYAYATLIGTFEEMSSSQIADYFGAFIKDYKLVFGMIAVNVVLTILVVRNNLQSGIEKISKILLPSLTVIILILVVRGLRLPNSTAGLKFFFTLDFSSFSFESVLVALGQTFFSIGIAMAVGLIFGSYQEEGQTDVVKNTTIIVASVIAVAIAAGMMIFPMASSFGLEMDAGPGLTFITMPNVFKQMVGGRIWGTAFYVAFFIAAFSSGIAGWEAVMAFLMDEFRLTRGKAIVGTLLLVCLVGIPATLSDSMFNMFDLLTNNIFLVLGAFLMTIFIGWVWGIEKLAEVAGFAKNPLLKAYFALIIKFIAPITIIILGLSQFGAF
jgi:NSS family neurotransmitter:Na+ symporter